MRAFEELHSFYEAIADDGRIGAYHICLYIALMRLRIASGWPDAVRIQRISVMQEARMGRKTFNKCMKDLSDFGYLGYIPSTSPKGDSKVYFKKL